MYLYLNLMFLWKYLLFNMFCKITKLQQHIAILIVDSYQTWSL